MIAYCKTDAQAAFTELADILEKTAATEIGGGQPDQNKSNAVLLDEIRQIVEANPIANPIHMAFKKAWGIADRAGDAETERELHMRHDDLVNNFNPMTNTNDQDDAQEDYKRILRSHAAWIRAISTSIDDSGKRSDEQAADGDEIARKVADVVGDKLKDIATDTHGAKVAAEEAAQLSRTGNAVAAQGFKTVIANQPQTLEAARQLGVAQHQSATAKRLNKKQ